MTTLGLVAGVLTTACWLPQLIRSWRTRSTSDISWLYLIVLTVGLSMWLLYGALRADIAIVMANSVTLVCLAFLIVIKWMERRARVPVG